MQIKSSPTSHATTSRPRLSWRTTAITAALGVLLSTAHLNANALALGALTSLSSLGEPFAAGIAIPEVTPEEFASLKITLGSPDAFKNAGMEYNPALSSLQITVNRRPDGTSYVLLRSDKAVTDPFVNLVINATWANGRIARNYTLLLDPPATRTSEAPAITAPIATLPAPRPVVPAPAPVVATAPATTPAATPTPAPAAANAAAPVAAKPAATPAQAVAAKAPAKNSGEQVKVSSGDTAGKIAANNKPTNVSLDQMLVAMLRGNPDAFIGNNVNRIKAGAILALPSEEEAKAVSESAARQSVIAQSKDFNNFRRKLAENAPSVASKTPDRQAGGKVEAKVEDRKTAVATPDKLTLSKGALNADAKAGSAKDNSEKIAKERQAKDDAARVAELSKNISDLNKVANGAATATPAKPAAPGVTTTPTAPAPASPTTAAKGSVAITTPAALATTGTPTSPATPATATPAAPNTPSTATTVGAAPATTPPAGVAGTPAAPAATTAAATPVKPVVKVPAAPVPEPSFIDELMDNPAVLPGAAGLLALLAAGGMYVAKKRKERAEQEDDQDGDFEDHSFFDTTNHHDAEPQAEEPAAVHAAEVAEPVAAVEPTFTLPAMPVVAAAPVQVETTPAAPVAAVVLAAQAAPAEDNFPAFTPSEFSARTVAQLHPETAKAPASVDLDLDFDFAVSGFHNATPAVAAMPAPATTDLSLDFDMPTAPSAVTAVTAVAAAAPVVQAAAPKASPETALGFAAPVVAAAAVAAAPLAFDLDNLSLDLNAAKVPDTAKTGNAAGPLETKLALAQEFRAIGDAAGAKMLAQEVIALATGSLKTKAENLLAEIG